MFTAAGIAAAGKFLGGVGSIAGAFSGGGSKFDEGAQRAANDVNFRHQFDADRLLRQQEFDQRMNLAKQHGLHPLSVLGINMAGATSPAVITGNDSGPDFGAIGYGANQIAKSFVKPETAEAKLDPNEQRIIDANVRLAEANAKRAEWEALRSEFATQDLAAPQVLLGQPGNPPGVRMSNDVAQMQNLVAEQSGIPRSYMSAQNPAVSIEQKVAPPHPRNVGHAAATDQGWQRIQDKNGNQFSVVRNDAVQADIEKGATFQALASVFGIERAMQITAVMENEGLLMGGALAAGIGIKKLGEYVYGRARGGPPQRYTPNWKKGGR